MKYTRRIMSVVLLVSLLGLTGCSLNGNNDAATGKNRKPEQIFVYAENQSEEYPATQAAYTIVIGTEFHKKYTKCTRIIYILVHFVVI